MSDEKVTHTPGRVVAVQAPLRWRVRAGVDARRFAACWNACAGIPTEVLEQGAVQKAMEDQDRLIRAICDGDSLSVDAAVAHAEYLNTPAAVSVDAALEEVLANITYQRPSGGRNCRFCDNNMDDEGTFEDMHGERCLVHGIRAALRKAEGK